MKIFRTTFSICYVLFTTTGLCCRIQGTDTGECVPPDNFNYTIPFCAPVVRYTACLPRYQPLWPGHSARTKDRWIKKLFNQTVTERMKFEINETLIDQGVNEWGEPLPIIPRFTENADCFNAFKNYFCYLNFPRCDAEKRSLLMCRSVCENFHRACKLSQDLKRCGDPQFVNAYSREISTEIDSDGLPVYYRFPFPGSPFRDNKFAQDKITPLIICTPSEPGLGNQHAPSDRLLLLVGFLYYYYSAYIN